MASPGRTVQFVFKAANERLSLRLEALVLRGPRPVVCECSDFDCFVVLELTRADYDAVRKAGRFIVATGHCAPELEHIVERRDGFDIVEKEDQAAA